MLYAIYLILNRTSKQHVQYRNIELHSTSWKLDWVEEIAFSGFQIKCHVTYIKEALLYAAHTYSAILYYISRDDYDDDVRFDSDSAAQTHKFSHFHICQPRKWWNTRNIYQWKRYTSILYCEFEDILFNEKFTNFHTDFVNRISCMCLRPELSS